MIKNIIKYLMLFLTVSISGQNINDLRKQAKVMDTEQLSVFINDAKKKGVSIKEAEMAIKLRGANENEILLLKELWNKDNSSLSYDNDDGQDNTIQSKFGFIEKNVTESKKPEDNRFGIDFFHTESITETPELYLSTPSDYRLGPGDQLTINLYGASENTYNATISRGGTIKIERIAPVYLSGLSIKQATHRLKQRLSKIYTGLNTSEEINKVEIDVSLKKSRSIVVNIVGNVVSPGTYTISGFSSILNALYASGGPNNVGSFRNIKLIRNGEEIKKVDLYDYFIKGIYPNIFLRDQDVILIPIKENEILVDYGFNRNKSYEMTSKESVSNLIEYAGGFLSKAYNEKVFIKRNNNLNIDLIEIDSSKYNEITLLDGDIVSAKIPVEYFENIVSISGSVKMPGEYSLSNSSTVSELISNSGGFNIDAFKRKATLHRMSDGMQNSVLSINLTNQEELNIKLKARDSLSIKSKNDLISSSNVKIIGFIENEISIEHKKNLTIGDMIILAGGFKEDADTEIARIFRNISGNQSDYISKIFEVELNDGYNTLEPFYLEPKDIISIQKKKNIVSTQSYSIFGEVETEGNMPIEYENQKISSILNDIKYKKTADRNSIYIERDSLKIPILTDKRNKIKVDFNIKNGDRIYFPRIENNITVVGEIQNENIIPFVSGKKISYYIQKSGGYSNFADKKNTYVVSLNGSASTFKNFLGINISPNLKPGDKIFVPTKEKKEKTSIGDILGITSGIASLVALIQIITQN